ncbi:MAG: NERD domain-containing protein, partial [Spirochaetota bacterium]|nr:NERD domain-containing protein [Spirochaetota bacterium]
MEIFRRGVILTQEEDVANKLKELPNNWLCIGGDGNRFSFKKGEGVQIDFIVISPKGILLIDAKNIHTIELIDGNTIRFLNAEGKQISKNKKRDNPIDDVIDDRYQAKDWLRERGLEDFLTKDKKDLKVFIHSIVVIANENNVQYKNCKLEQLSYYTHKYPSLIPLSNLNKDFFDSLYLPQNCKELSHEEMWTLFKIFYNPDMTITQILNEIRKEEDTLFQEKQVFLEKMRLLEQENIGLNKKVVDLEGTRNNLMSVNQALTNDIEKTNDEKEKIKNKLNSIETENRKLYEDNNELLKYKEYEIQLEDYREKYNESRKSIEQLENDINKLRSKKEKENIRIFKKRIIRYRIIFVPLIILLFVGWLMFFIMPSNDGIINADKTLSTIELIFPKIKDYYKESKYKELIKFWDNKVLMNGKKDFSLKDYLQYNIVFYYIAES